MSKQHLICSVQTATSLKLDGYFVPENDLLSIRRAKSDIDKRFHLTAEIG